MTAQNDLEGTLGAWLHGDATTTPPPEPLARAIESTRSVRPRPALVALIGSSWIGAGETNVVRGGIANLRPGIAVISLAAALVVAVVLGATLVRSPVVGPGATSSPSASSSTSPSPAPTEAAGGDFGTPLPSYKTFANPAYGWSVSYNADWSVFDDPFLAGPHGVTQFVPWNAGQLFVLVGGPGAGAPKPCSGCGTFRSRAVDDLAVEVLEFLRLENVNPPASSELPRTIGRDSLDGEDARYGYQTYPPNGHDFPSRDFVFVAIHGRRQYVIVLTPNIADGAEADWFPKFAHDLRFTTP
ncbi:MAG: hypothetical protein H0V73_11440 [Chloroflexi bacterium]|nr:hypothetical protein [Chloroflexota bacterium]